MYKAILILFLLSTPVSHAQNLTQNLKSDCTQFTKKNLEQSLLNIFSNNIQYGPILCKIDNGKVRLSGSRWNALFDNFLETDWIFLKYDKKFHAEKSILTGFEIQLNDSDLKFGNIPTVIFSQSKKINIFCDTGYLTESIKINFEDTEYSYNIYSLGKFSLCQNLIIDPNKLKSLIKGFSQIY